MSIPFKTTVFLRIGFILFAILTYVPMWQLFPITYQVSNVVKDTVTNSPKEHLITLNTKSDKSFQLSDTSRKAGFNVGDTFIVGHNVLLKRVSIKKPDDNHLYPIANKSRIGSYILFFAGPALLTLIIWRRKQYERDSFPIHMLCVILVGIIVWYYMA